MKGGVTYQTRPEEIYRPTSWRGRHLWLPLWMYKFICMHSMDWPNCHRKMVVLGMLGPSLEAWELTKIGCFTTDVSNGWSKNETLVASLIFQPPPMKDPTKCQWYNTQPKKTKMTIEKQPFEDVSPIKNADVPYLVMLLLGCTPGRWCRNADFHEQAKR